MELCARGTVSIAICPPPCAAQVLMASIAKPESAPTTPYGSRASSWSGSMSPGGEQTARARGCTAYLPSVAVRRFQPTGDCICVVNPTSVAEDKEEALAFNAFLLGPGAGSTKAGC